MDSASLARRAAQIAGTENRSIQIVAILSLTTTAGIIGGANECVGERRKRFFINPLIDI